jgi:predicted small integral membrane protein
MLYVKNNWVRTIVNCVSCADMYIQVRLSTVEQLSALLIVRCVVYTNVNDYESVFRYSFRIPSSTSDSFISKRSAVLPLCSLMHQMLHELIQYLGGLAINTKPFALTEQHRHRKQHVYHKFQIKHLLKHCISTQNQVILSIISYVTVAISKWFTEFQTIHDGIYWQKGICKNVCEGFLT